MSPVRVTIVGDALLDVDVVGTAQRLAPDAPVPVVDVERELTRPGGAGLAAMLARRDGCDVHLVTAIATDADGSRMEEELRAASLSTLALPLEGATPVKKRVLGGQHPLVRIDSGGGRVAQRPLTKRQRAHLEEILTCSDAVVVADYGRGVAAHPEIREALERHGGSLPLVWDPHPSGERPVRGTRVATPNVREAAQALRIPVIDQRWSSLGAMAQRLLELWDVEATVMTLGERGALLLDRTQSPMVLTAEAARGDTCGAGDRLTTRLAVLLAEGHSLMEAVRSAVDSAADFVASGGVSGHDEALATSVVSLSGSGDGLVEALELASRTRRSGGTVVAAGGCFDLIHSGHVSALTAARSLGDCLIVCVNSDTSVRQLKGPGRPLMGIEDRMAILTELGCVDAVCSFDELRPDELLRRLRPDVWVKGADYTVSRLPEVETMAEWGGQVLTVPYIPGRSSSALVAAALRAGGAA